MNRKIAVVAAALAFVANVPLQAATLVPLGGEVYDREGNQGFRPVTTTTEVKVGDTVLAGREGSAKIVLDNGCVIKVEPGQVVTVPESGCQAVSEAYEYLVIGGALAAVGTGIYFALENERHERHPRPVSP